MHLGIAQILWLSETCRTGRAWYTQDHTSMSMYGIDSVHCCTDPVAGSSRVCPLTRKSRHHMVHVAARLTGPWHL